MEGRQITTTRKGTFDSNQASPLAAHTPAALAQGLAPGTPCNEPNDERPSLKRDCAASLIAPALATGLSAPVAPDASQGKESAQTILPQDMGSLVLGAPEATAATVDDAGTKRAPLIVGVQVWAAAPSFPVCTVAVLCCSPPSLVGATSSNLV